jgi:hypothetical protein
MAGFSTTQNQHLIRAELWSNQLKETFKDELYTTKYLRMLEGFPDGDLFTIPSIGDMLASDYLENQAVDYTAVDTGEFQFAITEYLQAGTYITNKMKQDSYVMSQLVSSFVPKAHLALMKRFETDFMRVGPLGQTAADFNSINGVAHRWTGTGTDSAGSSNDTISIDDFARAKLALKKANAPLTNLVAIVDPSIEYTFNTLANLTNMINNPRWEGIVSTGVATGMQFKVNIMGFDVYTSNYVHLNTGAETISGHAAPTSAANNMFFSAVGGDPMPIIGAVRQPPKVDSEYNKDFQREEYVTTMRYGMKLYRPENLVVILTDPAITAPAYV